jgi:hypothetical protein
MGAAEYCDTAQAANSPGMEPTRDNSYRAGVDAEHLVGVELQVDAHKQWWGQ